MDMSGKEIIASTNKPNVHDHFSLILEASLIIYQSAIDNNNILPDMWDWKYIIGKVVFLKRKFDKTLIKKEIANEKIKYFAFLCISVNLQYADH